MVEVQFKSICRLNRLLVLNLVSITILTQWGSHGWMGKTLLIGLAILHFTYLMGNEYLLKMVKRLREADHQTITHLSVFLPASFAIYVGLNYFATGHFLVFLLGMFSILQAQFLGQSKLSRILAGYLITMFMMGLAFGFPKALALTPLQVVLAMTGMGVSLYYYGVMVSRFVRAHSTEVGKLQSMAATDVLTGLTNRRQFNNRLHEEVARARRHETPLSLALFDLDDFKRLNDFYGHPVGDRILRELGKTIRQNIRESDLPARYGGEEFAIILPETRETEAYELLERIRLLIAQTVFCLPENPLTVTISVGVAQLEARQHTSFELVELADKALYEAKKLGKNQVIKASVLMPKVLLKGQNKLHF
jgi:diguanylate cyclase (GGDEF)-like protein